MDRRRVLMIPRDLTVDVRAFAKGSALEKTWEEPCPQWFRIRKRETTRVLLSTHYGRWSLGSSTTVGSETRF